jgi:predicted SAM-dependent methyltransferase
MKTALKAMLKRAGWYQPVSNAWMRFEPGLIALCRSILRTNQRLTTTYLAETAEPKLHIGCGANHLEGWLNTELCPHGREIFLDATEPFPLPSSTFAFVYSEHMIEHIPHAQARAMVGECLRVLRPGGVLRLVTPNLAFLTSLLESDLTPFQNAYLDYSVRQYAIQHGSGSGVHVFNHFMRAWGHQFIYDQASLNRLVAEAGFVDVTPGSLSDSRHARLQGIAKVDRMPEGFLAAESIVVEARKPGL